MQQNVHLETVNAETECGLDASMELAPNEQDLRSRATELAGSLSGCPAKTHRAPSLSVAVTWPRLLNPCSENSMYPCPALPFRMTRAGCTTTFICSSQNLKVRAKPLSSSARLPMSELLVARLFPEWPLWPRAFWWQRHISLVKR